MKSIYKLHVTVSVNTFSIQNHAILGEGKYRLRLKSNPMLRVYVCTVYTCIMHTCLFYVCIHTVCAIKF